MASPLALRTPTCLACLRRIAQPATRPVVNLAQLRGKKTMSQLKVELLQDVPGWGPRGNIVLVPRLMMRHDFYPSGQARYITWEEWKQGKYTAEHISDRDEDFMMGKAEEDEFDEDGLYDPLAEELGRLDDSRQAQIDAPTEEPVENPLEIEELTPDRALDLINQFVPAVLTFERRLVHPSAAASILSKKFFDAKPTAAADASTTSSAAAAAEEPAKPILSGFAARRAKLAAQLEAERRKEQEAAQKLKAEQEAAARAKQFEEDLRLWEEQRKIHGSVSTLNVAQHIRDLMLLDPEAARIQIGAEDVTFTFSEGGGEGEGEGADSGKGSAIGKVEKVGTFHVTITPHVNKVKMDPIYRDIEIVPAQDGDKAAAPAGSATAADAAAPATPAE